MSNKKVYKTLFKVPSVLRSVTDKLGGKIDQGVYDMASCLDVYHVKLLEAAYMGDYGKVSALMEESKELRGKMETLLKELHGRMKGTLVAKSKKTSFVNDYVSAKVEELQKRMRESHEI